MNNDGFMFPACCEGMRILKLKILDVSCEI
jgi:hypothetical protein